MSNQITTAAPRPKSELPTYTLQEWGRGIVIRRQAEQAGLLTQRFRNRYLSRLSESMTSSFLNQAERDVEEHDNDSNTGQEHEFFSFDIHENPNQDFTNTTHFARVEFFTEGVIDRLFSDLPAGLLHAGNTIHANKDKQKSQNSPGCKSQCFAKCWVGLWNDKIITMLTPC